MLLFRSEEHVEKWCDGNGRTRGALLTLEQCWQLAQGWYARRLAPNWRRHTPAEAAAVFTGIGLTGDFWAPAQPAARP